MMSSMSKSPKAPAKAISAAESFNQICTIRIELLGTDPVIWREVEAPTSITLTVLHDIIQITMGWYDSHLWEFIIDKRTFGMKMDEEWGETSNAQASKTRLRDVLGPRSTRIDYMYDFGDSWMHRLTVTRIRQGLPELRYPRYVGGEWNGPPEDCGGIPGFYDTREILTNPDHPDHEDMREHYGDWDPAKIDERRIAIVFAEIDQRRDAARKRIASIKS